MTQCIYCKNQNPENFKGVEHVIPQSFGKFGSKTPTLKCVCDECNAYFAKELDLLLARDTLEGVTRSKKGIVSGAKNPPKSITFKLEEIPENGEFGGALLGGPDPVTGQHRPLLPQFWIMNIQTESWERYRLDEIKNIIISDEKYGPTTPGSRKMKVMGPSQEKYNDVLAELKKYNIPFRVTDMLDEIPFLKDIDPEGKVIVRGTIDGKLSKAHRRAFAKVLFNFATYYIGQEETLKPDWDEARNFIRHDGEGLKWRVSQKPFWDGQEHADLRFQSDSCNLRIENQNGNVVGIIQIYNLFTHEAILVENHQLPPKHEIAYRFTPGEEPYLGIKMSKPDWQ